MILFLIGSVLEIASLMNQFYQQFAIIHKNYSRDLKNLCESQIANLEEQNKSWSFGNSKIIHKDLGTMDRVWKCLKEELSILSTHHFELYKEITNEICLPFNQWHKSTLLSLNKIGEKGIKAEKGLKSRIDNLNLVIKFLYFFIN